MKLCECGCGLPAPIAKKTISRLGHVKGQPIRFIYHHQTSPVNVAAHPRWKGGRRLSTDGYILIHLPDHPRSTRGFVLEHIVIAERALGRSLPRKAHVHHVNEVRSDNAGRNLVICEDGNYHKLLHRRMNAYRRIQA